MLSHKLLIYKGYEIAELAKSSLVDMLTGKSGIQEPVTFAS